MVRIRPENLSVAEFASVGLAPRDRGIYLEHHVPEPHTDPYHFHPSVEVNYLTGCDMVYSFAGEEITVPRGRLCVFWAAYPHRAVSVSGKGEITNAYISLSEFLLWPMPSGFLNVLLGGAVLLSSTEQEGDHAMAKRWSNETTRFEPEWQRLHALEVQSRLYRMALQGWTVLLEPSTSPPQKILGGNAIIQFERMLRFVAQHFADRIVIGDVADAGGISPNYAISLFRKMLGRSIKEHITDMRIFHAKMQLTETDRKIVTIAMDCGFGSVSAFYDCFHNHTNTSPAAYRKGSGR